MGKQLEYNVIYEKGGVIHKICKVIFGLDGSYYVTCPGHPKGKALLLLRTLNYNLDVNTIVLSESIDLGVVEDEDKTFKLAHHRSGFVQFSGHGVISGKTEDGQIKGIGVDSFPLDSAIKGPAFSVVVKGMEQLVTEKLPKNPRVNFTFDETSIVPGSETFVLEGHYFPALWRRFVRVGPDGTKYIEIVHPCGAVLPLKVIFPSEAIEHQGFIGLELYSVIPGWPAPAQFFSMSGPSGNVRRNEAKELLGDSVMCMYPFPDFPKDADLLPRILDHKMRLSEPMAAE